MQPASHAFGLAHGKRADDHARRTGVEQGGDISLATHAPARLHLQPGVANDPRQQRGKRVSAGTRGVQVDQVQPACACIRIACGQRERRIVVARFAGVVALAQPYRPAVAHVDGGQQVECTVARCAAIGTHAMASERKLRNSCVPTVADRSGWN